MSETTTSMPESINSFSILSNIFSSPEKAFQDMQKSYPVLLPLILIITLNVIVVSLLFMNIDFDWYIEQMVEATAGDKSNAEQDQIRQGMSMMSPTMMSTMGSVGVIVGTLIMFSITSLYFVIVSNITNDGFQFRQWFSFVAWSSTPVLIDSLASLVMVITTGDGQLTPERMNPLSLNELFFGLNAYQGAGNILASTSLTMFASIALMTIGYAKWTSVSVAKALTIVIIPYVIYFGARLLMI